MIRFRLGHRFKREPAANLLDSIGLELDGVELLPGASEEPLAEVVPALVEAVAALAKGKRGAQVSLYEAHLELCLLREGDEVRVSVVSLERPARLLRPTARVELAELCEATAACAKSFADTVGDRWTAARRRKLLEKVAKLSPAGVESKPPAPLTVAVDGEGFGFKLVDAEGRLRELPPDEAGLTSLLVRGELWLCDDTGAPLWRAEGVVFLAALELARQTQELAHAIDLREERFSFSPGGLSPKLELNLAAGRARVGTREAEVDGRAFERRMAALGAELAVALRREVPRQAKNPHLVELRRRCEEALSHHRAVASSTPEAGKPARKARGQKPLETRGKLKKLRFERAWDAAALPANTLGEVRLGPKGPIVASGEQVVAFLPDGQVRFRRASKHGVAVALDDTVLVSTEDRLLCFSGARESASWLRNHDGLPLGPWLTREDHFLLGLSEGRAAIAIEPITGRELWRLAPPRTQRAELLSHSGLVWLTTDGGFLLGANPQDGQLHLRVRAPMPFIGPAQPLGDGAVMLLGRGSASALLALPPGQGEVRWTAELALSKPALTVHGGKCLVVGEHEGEARALLFDAQGRQKWDRTLPLGKGPYSLLPFRRAFVVVDRQGNAVRLDGDGRTVWRVGSEEATECSVAPVIARQLLLLPGEPVRVIDLQGGQPLGELDAGAGLCGLAADAKLNVYALDEDGTLKAYRLSTHLAVVR